MPPNFWVRKKNKFCAAELMFGLVELELEIHHFFFAFLLVWLILCCIPKISFALCLEVHLKFVWVVGGGWWSTANLVIALA
jgi:hypothetical protein